MITKCYIYKKVFTIYAMLWGIEVIKKPIPIASDKPFYGYILSRLSSQYEYKSSKQIGVFLPSDKQIGSYSITERKNNVYVKQVDPGSFINSVVESSAKYIEPQTNIGSFVKPVVKKIAKFVSSK